MTKWLSTSMASTQQGARDFIQNNWDKAVAGLNHVHLLLPGLRTTRVLDENEISDIDSCNERFEKNRKVLGMIVKKGNAACEVFLNLLDTKRKWSLDGGAHHWIDCFNFDDSSSKEEQSPSSLSPGEGCSLWPVGCSKKYSTPPKSGYSSEVSSQHLESAQRPSDSLLLNISFTPPEPASPGLLTQILGVHHRLHHHPDFSPK
ncbi:uncharacterized protein LOC120520755 isoform X2 [Polypterus senegalus]|uniref:uncharacterized protein LOC120520755 isoform X2 n=1 Tax=Polypterus senegalus TaxID=55291 RepID=UPI001964EF74|nr:uncharacterized protein LOC120520755 isoform X2 [Polypterus senegalus]